MITIWHNPRCSKSRQTLALLQENSFQPDIRLYQDNAPSEDELRKVITALGCKAIEIVRTGEALFKELGLKQTDDDDTLIAAMASHPKLIERPIVLVGNRAAIGRPPSQVLDIV